MKRSFAPPHSKCEGRAFSVVGDGLPEPGLQEVFVERSQRAFANLCFNRAKPALRLVFEVARHWLAKLDLVREPQILEGGFNSGREG